MKITGVAGVLICIVAGIAMTHTLIFFLGLPGGLLALVFLYVGLHITRHILKVPKR